MGSAVPLFIDHILSLFFWSCSQDGIYCVPLISMKNAYFYCLPVVYMVNLVWCPSVTWIIQLMSGYVKAYIGYSNELLYLKTKCPLFDAPVLLLVSWGGFYQKRKLKLSRVLLLQLMGGELYLMCLQQIWIHFFLVRRWYCPLSKSLDIIMCFQFKAGTPKWIWNYRTVASSTSLNLTQSITYPIYFEWFQVRKMQLVWV